MNEPDFRPLAHAIRREWSTDRLDPMARARVAKVVAERRHRARRRRAGLAGAGAAAVLAVAVPAAIAGGLFGEQGGTVVRGGALAARPGNAPGGQARAVVERVAAVVRPRSGGYHYRARVRRTDGPPRRSTYDATVFLARRRARFVERDPSGRVVTRAAATPHLTTLHRRGERIFRVRRYFGIAPEYLDAHGLRALRRALPSTSVSGPKSVGGRKSYVLSWESSDSDTTWRQVLTVDAVTFMPIRHVRTLVRAPDYLVSPRPGDRVTSVIERFERLP